LTRRKSEKKKNWQQKTKSSSKNNRQGRNLSKSKRRSFWNVKLFRGQSSNLHPKKTQSPLYRFSHKLRSPLKFSRNFLNW
jgi:hypothetical protein